MEGKELMGNRRGNMYNNKSRQAYMSQPNVKEFNKCIREHNIGRPYAFDNKEVLEKELNSYFDLCDKTDTVPSITGISMWLGCNRDTIYAHANNSNSPFSDIFKNVINYCHLTIENGTIDGKINPVTYIFLAKNYFNLEDSKQITVSAQQGSDVNSQETAEALRKQLEEETTPNAEIISEK